MDANTLIVGLVAGAFGMVYLAYGKKQAKLTYVICGVLLIAYPYFTDNIWILLVVGLALAVAPWVLK
jgi:hypothetical protein